MSGQKRKKNQKKKKKKKKDNERRKREGKEYTNKYADIKFSFNEIHS